MKVLYKIILLICTMTPLSVRADKCVNLKNKATVHQALIMNVLVPYNTDPEHVVTTQMLAEAERIVMKHNHTLLQTYPFLNALLLPSLVIHPFVNWTLQTMPWLKDPNKNYYIQALTQEIEHNHTYGIIKVILGNKYGHRFSKFETALQYTTSITVLVAAIVYHRRLKKLATDIWSSLHEAL